MNRPLAPMRHGEPLSLRRAWQQLGRQQPAALLRVGLLASYTADPLVPYLGVHLHDAGLAASLQVGPFNQIVQQCLDDGSETARQRPDILVVAPRLEELLTGKGMAGAADELAVVADAAAAAADRWGSLLVFVLPAVPEDRPYGAADGSSPYGVMAAATGAREAVRARIADLPHAVVADAEEAVRAIGSRRAYHPTLFRFAKIPYTEELFAELGHQVASLVRARCGATWRVAVLDAGGLPATELAPCAELLRRAGVRVTTCAANEGRPHEQLARLGVPPQQAVLITADPAHVDGPLVDGHCAAILLGPDPDRWPAQLRRAGALDRLPPYRWRDRTAPTTAPTGGPTGGPAPALADFVASLNVQVSCEPVRPDTLQQAAEVVARAKDFTLGRPYSAAELAAYEGSLLAVRVRDRYGDCGISGVVGYADTAGCSRVELFSLSCPVLGKGVPERVLGEVVEHADRAGRQRVQVRLRPTPHNRAVADFLAAASGRAWSAGSGRNLTVQVVTDGD